MKKTKTLLTLTILYLLLQTTNADPVLVIFDENGNVTEYSSYSPYRYLLILLIPATIIIESLTAIIYLKKKRIPLKATLITILLINIITVPLATELIKSSTFTGTTTNYIATILLTEAGIITIEALLLKKTNKKLNTKQAFTLSILMNTASYATGRLIMWMIFGVGFITPLH